MLDKIKNFALNYLIADLPPLSLSERWHSIMATLIGLLLASALAWYLPAPLGQRWLVAPIGATAVILFVQPHSPLAQPWSLFGGYFLATLSTVVFTALLPESPPLIAVFSVTATVALMSWLRCLHPPGGALAFVLAFSQQHEPLAAWRLFLEVGLDAAFLMLAALLVNNLLLRRRYPHCRAASLANQHHTQDLPPTARLGLSHADLQTAMQKLDTFIDVQEADLVSIYNHAVDHAFDRHSGLRCADLMARDIVSVEFADDLETAWNKLRTHKLRALPVVDRNNNRLQGIVTVADFLKQFDASRAATLGNRLQQLLTPSSGSTSDKPEVVGQIMTANPYCARPETPVSELVHQLSDANRHHVPVINERRQVIGMVTQSDLIAALFKQMALAHSTTN